MKVLWFLLLLMPLVAGAAEVEGVKIDDKTRVANADVTLTASRF